MFYPLVMALTIGLWSNSASSLTFDRYHDVGEINQYLDDVALEHTELASVIELGLSAEGRAVRVLRLGKGPEGKKPGIFVNAAHHGDEKVSTESAISVIQYVLTNHKSKFLTQVLNSFDLYVQPLVNPDGHARGLRFAPVGVDPNRDYAYPGSNNAFKLSEVRLVRDFLKAYDIRAAVALHSGMEGVLWPFCFANTQPRDQKVFRKLARSAAKAMGMGYFAQSFVDYPSKGEFIDYAYITHGTLALTFEVSSYHQPKVSDLKFVVSRATLGVMDFIRNIDLLQQNLISFEDSSISASPSDKSRNL